MGAFFLKAVSRVRLKTPIFLFPLYCFPLSIFQQTWNQGTIGA